MQDVTKMVQVLNIITYTNEHAWFSQSHLLVLVPLTGPTLFCDFLFLSVVRLTFIATRQSLYPDFHPVASSNPFDLVALLSRPNYCSQPKDKLVTMVS